MERVEAAFIANGESYKFTDFENLLRSFDATSEKASDLYLVRPERQTIVMSHLISLMFLEN